MPVIMDQTMKDYLRTARTKPAPTQESLTNVFLHVSQVRIFQYTRRGNIKTVALVQDPQALRELQVAMSIRDGPAGHCMCIGDPQLLLEKEDAPTTGADETARRTVHELAKISVHHGHSIRWDEAWCTDAWLTKGIRLLEWLDKHGYPAALQAYHNQRKQNQRDAQVRQHWQEATPECLRGVRLDPYKMNDALEKLQTGMPNPLQRCRALLEWYGSGAGPWSGYPQEEDVALKLLEQESISVVVDAANSLPQTTALLEGAARFFSMTRIQLPPLMDDGLKGRLREHVQSTGRRDNQARFNARFGPKLALEGCLKLIQTDWSTLDITAGDDGDFYTFPEGAWFVPQFPANTFLGWIERFAWWDEAWEIRAAAIAVRLVLDAFGESFSLNNQDRRAVESAITTAQDWLVCPCERHQKVAQTVYKNMKEVLPQRHAIHYLISSASWLAWAVEGVNSYRAKSSIEYAKTSLASLCARMPEKASHFDSFYMEGDDHEKLRQYLREAEVLLTRQIRNLMEPLIQQKLWTQMLSQAKKAG